MTRKKAVLIFDPNRRPEQLAYVADRTQILHEAGDQAWVSLTEQQADRFAEQGIVVQFHDDADLVELPAIVFDPTAGEPEPPPSLRADAPAAGQTARYLVQFIGPIDRAWIHEIAGLGGTFVQNLPVNVGVFRLSTDEAAAVRQLPFVQWLGIFHPAYALSYELAGREQPFEPAALRDLAVAPASLPGSDQGNVQVRLFDDADPAEARAAIGAAGATIVVETGNGFVLSVTAATLTSVLRAPGVFAVEPFFPPTLANNRGGIIITTNQVRNFGNVDFLVNLDGAGQIVGVIDSGLDTGVLPGIHADLGARVLQINHLLVPGTAVRDLPPRPHGTHVTGTIAGDGTGSAGRVRGMAPACSIIFHGPLAANYQDGFTTAHTAGARVHNNSWGTVIRDALGNAVATNNLYRVASADAVDRFCFAYPDSLVLFAAGNDERDVQPAPGGDGVLDMNLLTFEAVAKNILTIGACESDRNNDGWANTYRAFFAGRYNHATWNVPAGGTNLPPGGAAVGFIMSDNANEAALFSNRGIVRRVAPPPAGHVSTGRVKPDLVAPGTNILSLRSSLTPPPVPATWDVSRTEAPALYQLMHGTSMATPHVSGAAILTRQYYRARFGQLRRPTLLEGVALPAPPAAQPDFVDRPAICPHADGLAFAWVTPAVAGAAKNLTAARYSRELTRPNPTARQLQADVGEHPAPALVRDGEHTLLLHRHRDASIRLSRFRRDLTPDAAFGVNGTVTLAPLSRLDDARPPAMLVFGNQVVVAWSDGGSEALLLQRFNATTGAAVQAAPTTVGNATHTGPHPFITHTGARYALAWVEHVDPDRFLRLRLVELDGTPVGAQPQTIRQQPQAIRDPHLIWDARHNRFVLVWCDSRTNAGGEIYLRFADANGAPIGAEVVAMSAPATTTMRRPFVALHPEGGYVLLWEDTKQNGRHDVYLTFLDDNGQPDGRIPVDASDDPAPHRPVVRLSDTPDDTRGFAALVDASGPVLTWLSTDEINSDRRGAYALNLTPQGAFQAQADPNTPLINSGQYVAHRLLEHASRGLTSVAMAWAGGFYFLLRGGPPAIGISDELQLVRANADGRVDTTYGTGGVRSLPTGVLVGQHATRWTGDRLICATVGFLEDPRVYLFDGAGDPVRSFGNNGVQSIQDPTLTTTLVSPQVGHRTTPAFRVVFVYGVAPPGAGPDIRYTVLNRLGNPVVAPRTLAAADGTARQGWFQVVNSENRSIAVWHRQVPGADLAVFANQYRPNGTALHAADIQITPAGGATDEARNPVVAPRPVAINSMQREYGVAWQFRASNAVPFEIRFSRLDRNAQVMANPPPAVPPALPPPAVPTGTGNVRVIFPGAPGWPPGPAALDAIEPQLVSTYTHEPWANPPAPLPVGTALPQWSPSYGLAWLGQPTAGGARSLFFTALDENGVRLQLPQAPPNPPLPAPITRVSRDGVDVQQFHLIWNGRTFRLTWTETEEGIIRHMQTALTRHGSQRVFAEPSAALLRATLINGATNINNTALPNVTNGYGWGRVNLRQSLAPSPPITFQARDDNAVGPGRAARYRFYLPPGTALLRATLTWNDPPGARLVNRLHLRITVAGQRYQGNTWQAAPNGRLSRPVAAGTPFQRITNTEQIVLENPPSGDYTVDVIAEVFPVNTFNQLNAQPFALVFVGSGPEVRFGGLPAAGIPVY